MCWMRQGRAWSFAGRASPERHQTRMIAHSGRTYDIRDLSVSPAKGKDFEEDVLGDEQVEAGDETLIRCNHLEKTGVRDLKVGCLEDGSTAIWCDINHCKISTVTIKYDRKRDKTTAVFD